MKNRLLYLDRHYMTEAPFLQKLAGSLAEQRGKPPTLIVHGSGSYAEQALEGKGLFRDRKEGLLHVQSSEERDLVDRATRQYNKRLVAMLTEQGLPAVGVTGTSRNLLRLGASDDGGSPGGIEAHRTAWLAETLEGGALPVVAALGYDPQAEHIREIRAAHVAATLARTFDAEVVFFGKGGAARTSQEDEALPVSALTGDEVAEPEAVRAVVEAGVEASVVGAQAFREQKGGQRVAVG